MKMASMTQAFAAWRTLAGRLFLHHIPHGLVADAILALRIVNRA
jgi:hypothetical protein